MFGKRYCRRHIKDPFDVCDKCQDSPDLFALDHLKPFEDVRRISSLWNCVDKLVGPQVKIGEDKVHYPAGDWVWEPCPKCVRKELPLLPNVDEIKSTIFENVYVLCWTVLPSEPFWEPEPKKGYRRVLVKSTVHDCWMSEGFKYVAYDHRCVLNHSNPFYDGRVNW